jgi:hypothetical protein
MYMYTRVGRVLEIFDTCQLQFSQNNLQKSLIFTFNFWKKIICQDRVSILKIWTCSHNVSFHKFEKNQLFFDSSHKPVITFFPNKNNYNQVSVIIIFILFLKKHEMNIFQFFY